MRFGESFDWLFSHHNSVLKLFFCELDFEFILVGVTTILPWWLFWVLVDLALLWHVATLKVVRESWLLIVIVFYGEKVVWSVLVLSCGEVCLWYDISWVDFCYKILPSNLINFVFSLFLPVSVVVKPSWSFAKLLRPCYCKNLLFFLLIVYFLIYLLLCLQYLHV